MHPELLDSIQRLKPLGRWLYDHSTETLWERDTRTLPRDLQRRRRAYRRFAEQFIAPLAREADRDPEGVDLGPLYREAGRRGFLSEAAPWPIGTMPWRAISGRHIFHFALKAEEFCAACGGIGLALLFHDLGMAPLLLCGDLGVWRRWLWPICRANRRGEIRLVAYAITEPEAGSDVEESEGATSARFCTVARKVRGGYVIQGQKVFISGGSRADYVVVFAVLEREDGQPPRVDRDFTAFIVERGREGFRTGRRERKLGQRACDATQLFFDQVFVPETHRIGPERSGWALNRNVLNYSRAVVGAIALGIARGAVEAATRFARETRLGNRPLLAYPEVQVALAELWALTMAMRAMVWQSARYRRPVQGIAAATKALCADLGVYITTRALDLMGDWGYMPAWGVEKALRDVRLNPIYEGTNQINMLALVESFWVSDLAGVPYPQIPSEDRSFGRSR
jgi:alkylation response protein AidB-like acyl-CoA dehydrogenase